eukprot:3126288-Pleurochrysis_carterae.AAC.2
MRKHSSFALRMKRRLSGRTAADGNMMHFFQNISCAGRSDADAAQLLLLLPSSAVSMAGQEMDRRGGARRRDTEATRRRGIGGLRGGRH